MALKVWGEKQEVFEYVWPALEANDGDAINLAMRSHLKLAIEKQVVKLKLSQEDAAKRQGITRPRLSDLLRGKINKFSLEVLMTIALRAKLKVLSSSSLSQTAESGLSQDIGSPSA